MNKPGPCPACNARTMQGAPVLELRSDGSAFCRSCNHVTPGRPATPPPMTQRACLDTLVEWWVGGLGYNRRLVLEPAGTCTVTISWTYGAALSRHVEQHTFTDGLMWPSAALAAVNLLREKGQL